MSCVELQELKFGGFSHLKFQNFSGGGPPHPPFILPYQCKIHSGAPDLPLLFVRLIVNNLDNKQTNQGRSRLHLKSGRNYPSKFYFGLARFTQLLTSFGRCADEEESSENALTCPAQSPHGVQAQTSTSSFVNSKATSSRLLA